MTPSHGKVLVTDARALSSLAIARSLGAAGVDVHVCDDFRATLSSFSTHVSAAKTHPPIGDDPTDFVEWLVELCERERYDLVIPVRDETLAALSEHRSELIGVTDLFMAENSVIERLMDKGECMKLAEEVGVPIPETYYPADDAAGLEAGLETIRERATFPVLIKPRIASGARGIARVEGPAQLASKYEAVAREHPDPIVQEYVDHSGGHYSIGTLFDRSSEPVATHVYKETKQYPTSGGPAVNAVSVPKDPWVDELLDLLRAVDWQGPAHMDVLYDPADETYKLLEVNPRFWMSLTLSIRSGVDVPALLFDLAQGRTPEPVCEYAVGTRYRWVFPNEILWALNNGNKKRALRQLLRPSRNGVCYGVVSREDPTPLVGMATQSLRFLLAKDKREMIFDRGWTNEE
jgi:predicted ATP-grasp superfamily ATP-dependent carboligase